MESTSFTSCRTHVPKQQPTMPLPHWYLKQYLSTVNRSYSREFLPLLSFLLHIHCSQNQKKRNISVWKCRYFLSQKTCLIPDIWNRFLWIWFGSRVDPKCHLVDRRQSELDQTVTRRELNCGWWQLGSLVLKCLCLLGQLMMSPKHVR